MSWNGGGTAALSYFEKSPLDAAAGAAAAPAAAAGGKGKGKGAPTPPKADQIKAPPPLDDAEKPKAGGGGMTAVFADINKFSTGALKKVTPDMKSKNLPPADPAMLPKAASNAGAATAGYAKSGAAAKERKPPSMTEKQGNWIVENYVNSQEMVTLDQADMKQLVYVLNCENTTIKISTKVKNVALDTCKRVNIVVQDVVSAVELVNCDRCKVQVLGAVNCIAIDKCNGVNVFLSKDSLGAEITSSKSSEMNLTVPSGVDDWKEMPVPEQFVTKLVNGKLETRVSDLYSS